MRCIEQINANRFIAWASEDNGYTNTALTFIFIHEVTKWCEEMFGGDKWWASDFYGTFEFEKEEDAVLFKLRWM